jgi:hypothetical protein
MLPTPLVAMDIAPPLATTVVVPSDHVPANSGAPFELPVGQPARTRMARDMITAARTFFDIIP